MVAGELDTPRLDLIQAQQPRLVVVPHALGVVVDDDLDEGQLVLHLQDLVDLLLVLAHDHPGFRVIDDVVDLRGDSILVDGHGHATEGLRRDHGPVELGAVVADDGDLVTAAEAEAGEAEGDAPHVLDVILPRMCLPDPELLLADGHGRSEALGIVERELREGAEAGGRHQECVIRRVGWLAHSHCLRPRAFARITWDP